MSWIQIPPEAAHFSLGKRVVSGVVVLCCIALLCCLTVVVHVHYVCIYIKRTKKCEIEECHRT